MLPDWKRATLWGIILWILILIESTIINLFNLDPMTQKMIHLIILPFLVALCTALHFKARHTNLRKGFIVGIYFLIITITLDLVLTTRLISNFPAYYEDWSLWIGFIEVILFSSFTAGFRRGMYNRTTLKKT